MMKHRAFRKQLLAMWRADRTILQHMLSRGLCYMLVRGHGRPTGQVAMLIRPMIMLLSDPAWRWAHGSCSPSAVAGAFWTKDNWTERKSARSHKIVEVNFSRVWMLIVLKRNLPADTCELWGEIFQNIKIPVAFRKLVDYNHSEVILKSQKSQKSEFLEFSLTSANLC